MITLKEALKLCLENKNKSFEYNAGYAGEIKKGYAYFCTSLNKVMFVSYGIPCSFTEKEAKGYINGK